MISEVLMGREGRSSPIHTMRILAKKAGRSRRWALLGWLGVITGFLILSYYAVIAGWALNYVWLTANGTFDGASGDFVAQAFTDLQANPLQMIAYQTVFMVYDSLDCWARGYGGSWRKPFNGLCQRSSYC